MSSRHRFLVNLCRSRAFSEDQPTQTSLTKLREVEATHPEIKNIVLRMNLRSKSLKAGKTIYKEIRSAEMNQ